MQHFPFSVSSRVLSASTLLKSVHKVFYQSNLLYSIRIIISLAGSTFAPYYFGHINYAIPLTLGVVAAALTEIDTRFASRLLNNLFTLLCFAIASFSVQCLFDYPWLFIIGLISSTFLFTMLGSLGQKYSIIAFSSLLIAAYTMLGHSLFDDGYLLPLFLLIGALWYQFTALIESLILPARTTQQQLSASFIKLALYLDAKAAMFDPDETDDFGRQTAQLTETNSQVVAAFNHAKHSLFNRMRNHQRQYYLRKMLSYYFVAQDIHERASSAHGNYQALSRHFKHSDILFRFARILNLQSKACAEVSIAIKYNQPYQHSPLFANYFAYLDDALKRIKADTQADSHLNVNHSINNLDAINPKTLILLLKSLRSLYNNLQAIDLLLANIDQQQQLSLQQEQNQLVDDALIGIHDIVVKIKNNLTIKSSLFRHSVRMSLVFVVGYSVITLTGIPHGYWIMLTSLFVCQPNYWATKHRLQLRVIGTLLGVVIGVPLTLLFPHIEMQLVLIVISGWLFFLFKNSQYAYATAFITLLVVFIFNLLGESTFLVAIYRILATVIGCLIAWLAVTFVWPDWKFRNLASLIAKVCRADGQYLQLIESQYQLGKTNDVNYRLARRAAHDCNADLSALINIMSKEPKMNKQLIEQSFRLLILNHTLISYLSTLGAHREKTISAGTLALFDESAHSIIQSLHHTEMNDNYLMIKQSITYAIDSMSEPNDIDNHDLLVMQQLLLIFDILPEMIEIAGDLKKNN